MSYKRVVLIIALIVLAGLILYNAWLCDDAYITMRTVDNFVNGYGLTWNISERVQPFTHPLWMFFLTLLYLLTGETFLTIIIASVLLSVTAGLIIFFKLSRTLWLSLFGFLILIFSKAFIEYTTSGLENPLSYFLLAVFFWIYFDDRDDRARLLRLSVVAGLIALTRMDLLLIVLPPLIVFVRQKRPDRWIVHLLVGFLPFLLWELFSLYYYGFLFPNSAYAKINVGIDRFELIPLGWRYFYATLKTDPLTIIIIITGLFLPVLKSYRGRLPVTSGMLLYLIYILYIGGDFMVGRFFNVPLLVTVIIIVSVETNVKKPVLLIACLAVIIVGLLTPRSPVTRLFRERPEENRTVFEEVASGITDERLFYFYGSSLLNYGAFNQAPYNEWAERGRRFRNKPPSVWQDEMIGFLGYYAGPRVHIIDELALADPLLARLPAMNIYDPRPGHFRRKMPGGYWETISSEENFPADSNLARYYEKLCVITRGSLGSGRRLLEIIKMNLGYYNDWLKAYLENQTVYRQPTLIRMDYQDISNRRVTDVRWNGPDCIVMSSKGIEVLLPEVKYSRRIGLSLDDNDIYEVIFRLRGEDITSYFVHVSRLHSYGLKAETYDVPAVAREKGFDLIAVKPAAGLEGYSLGHLILYD